ncbi:FAD-dependent oxidoreductase [Limibacillus sp. MBR-115]|jgi:dimethylglycine dehydrogenase|uniref:GcvT family protein n=1 Tax=Limibacillus sp. MBR-115 TaxID=3156465 RepID=UPI003392AE51
MAQLPSHARVVIIGGGVVGCSSLYHIAKMGWSDCVLLEKNELTSGSTWHAAGNCPSFSGSWSIMKMQRYSTALYTRLADEVDYPMNYHNTGSIRLAHSKDRMEEFQHVVGMARHQGIDFDMMTTEEMRAAHPFLETHDILGGVWDPTDGDIDPAQLTQAFAKGARDLGAKIIRFAPVTDVRRLASGEWEVITAQGSIRCEKVVNAAGYRAAEVGRFFGRDVPSVAMAHQYLVTESVPKLAALNGKVPLLRDPDISYYLRQERDGLILGPYEWQATPHWVNKNDPMPEDFSFQLYPDDLERLEFYIEDACRRVPILGKAGIQKVINGPIPYTPDGNPLVGPMPGVPNAFEACVFSFGITQGGGAGKVLAEWVVEGETEWDMWSIDPRRFTGYVTKEYTRAKAVELYQREYAIGYPNEERPAGRPAKTSPLYETLRAKGAVFGARAGWERACWFPRAGKDEAENQLSFHRTNWFDAVGEECKAVQEAVGILDLPGFARFEVSGDGAAAWLEDLITGTLPKPGRIGLVYFATKSGRILTEMTVTRFAEDHFWLMTASGAEWHDRDWLLAHLPADSGIKIDNVTAAWGTLVLTGPKSRTVLAQVCENDLSSESFPWLSHQPIVIGMARGRAIRVSYAGELGWEIHLPNEYMVGVYQALWTAGEAEGIRDFGIYALNAMRLEKCYRSWKEDLSTDFSPLAGALDRFVKLDKAAFVGRDALFQEKQEGPSERFVPLIVDAGTADAPYLATIWKDGERVGLVTSGGYGHRIGKSIALSYVRRDLAVEGTALEVDIFGERFSAVVGSEPLYDPSNSRLKS